MPVSSSLLTHRGRRRLAGGLLTSLALAGALIAPATASAAHQQIAIIQDGGALQANPAGTLQQMRDLGATTVRVILYWTYLAPDIQSTRRPKFNASDPAAYPPSKWALWDTIVRDATADGLTVDLDIAGGAPRWAEGSAIPSNYLIAKNSGALYFAWKPNANDYGQFVHAVAERYDGHYTAKGGPTLPRVHFWTIWNEPNFGEDLGPQATDTSRISYAPQMYRNLVRTGWRALRQTGHGKDTIVIGEFAAHGSALSDGRHGATWPQGLPGNSGQTQPLPFIDTLYCLSPSGAELTSTAAAEVGCPTTAAGRAAFRRNNPGLFSASGVGDHPYANNGTPVSDGVGNPEWATFPNFPRLERTLDGANRAWGSSKRYDIYNDEYGYITDPPQTTADQSVPVATAARYLNWAEYISWRSPRVASYSQYLLDDPSPNPQTGNAGFASGLYTDKGRPKATLNAYRMPVWIPTTSLPAGSRFTVWGEARPAAAAGLQTKQRQSVAVQFRAHGKGAWKTVDTVRSATYFTLRLRLPSSGDVRLRYTYPRASADVFLPIGVAGSTIVSRTVAITVR